MHKAPDGKRVAMGSETGQIYLFDVESGTLANTYTSHAMGVRSLAWSADSQVNFALVLTSERRNLIAFRSSFSARPKTSEWFFTTSENPSTVGA